MDQVKIGKFIALCRKEKGMTQADLAEKLGISDRAVSKWETGKSLPDSGNMLELCEYIGITVNELLSGEKIMTEDFGKAADENLLKLKKENEEQVKRMLNLENVIGYLSAISFLILIFTASYVKMEMLARVILILLGITIFVVGVVYCILIEQKAGYYRCGECGNRYVPTYKQVLFARHRGRTRYMTCPQCGKRTWQKKVTGRE
ncbi:MAG: helix-turn-helix transcriptional regulator [Hornefia sp.]|nr:helix-turn-helix transcriptional regulator [Hornefia sp.]